MTHERRLVTRALAVACGLALGCSSSHGSDDPDGSVARDAGRASDGAVARPGDVWDGYIESFMFPSGSDHVRIAFDFATGDGSRTGFVVFGAGPAPLPSTDPDIGFPSSLDWTVPLSGYVAEGFEYPIAHALVTGSRVQVTVQTAALWDSWCRLQTPVPLGASETAFGCLPDTTGAGGGAAGCYYTDASGMAVTTDCVKLLLCLRYPNTCRCDATSCVAGSVDEISFDFHVTGNAGDGSVSLGHAVHLTR